MNALMPVVYRVKDWARFFENAGSRKVSTLSWIKVPNRHDSAGYRRVMMLKDGIAVYGAWLLIVQVASKMPVRGTLENENGPLDATDLAARTGAPAKAFDRAFEVLTDPKIGWLERVATSPLGDAGSVLPERPDEASPHNQTRPDTRRQQSTVGSFAKRGGKGGADGVQENGLDDPTWLAKRFELRVKRGLIGGAEADRLDYFALAAKARRVGTRNRAGMFAKFEADFDEARKRIPARDEETARRMLNGRMIAEAVV